MKINRIQKTGGRITKTTVDIPVKQWTQVRIEPSVYEKLEIEAKQAHRTTTAHINFLLAKSLSEK